MFSKKRPQSREVDEKLNELGTILKEAREKKGISLEDIFESTKIQVKLLRALEEGNYAAYPGDVYVRGALRNYADAVGLDYKEISALYKKVKGEAEAEAKPEPIAKEPEKEPIIVQQIVKPKSISPAKKSKGMRPAKKPINLKPLFITLVVLLILYLGAMGINYILNSKGNNSLPPVDDPAVDDPTNGTDEDPDPDNGEPDEVEIALIKADPRREDYILQGAENIQLILSFTGECWVRVDQGGEKVMSTTFRSGQTYTLDADQDLLIRLGYPRRVSVFQVNGLDINVIDTRDPYNITINLEP
jgi:cytoskeletal protein RodZ